MRSWVMTATLVLSTTLAAATARADDVHNLCHLAAQPAGVLPDVPSDDGIHFDSDSGFLPYEQYYYVSDLRGLDGRRYGLQSILFQFAFSPASFGLPWEFPQAILTLGQASLTDVQAQTFESSFVQSFEIDGGNALPVLDSAYDLLMDDAATRILVRGGGGRDRIEFDFPNGKRARLHLESLKDPMYGFFAGFGAYTDPDTGFVHGEQFYYSRTRMATAGALYDGARWRPVAGTSWQDRQYGSVIGTPGTDADNVNWVWVLVQLDDGREYLAWDMKSNATGNTLIHVATRSGAPPRCAQSTITAFELGESDETFESDIAPGHIFPQHVELSIPEESLHIDIRPLVQDSVVVTGGAFSPTMEAASDVFLHGTDTRIGSATIEITRSCCQPPQN